MVALLIGVLAAQATCQEAEMKLVGTAPCNVFQVGEAIAFEGVDGDVTGVVRDYDGAEVWSGEGEGGLTVPALGPGYYELAWKAGDGEGVVSLGIVPARPDEPPPDGPLAVDGATAWLSGPSQWEPIAKMLRRTGIGWMRERLSWGAVNPEEGKLEWGKYQTVADVLTENGVRVYQIFHDTPQWMHPGKETRNPDDLRHVYRFCKDASAHFDGDILAWEPWNEPDIFFFDQTANRYSGIQKAAFLGFRAGNPKVEVLSCSFCRGKSAFSDACFESGIGDYFDTFNFHTYSPIERYVDTLEMWTNMARDYGVGDRPIWLTEAGVRLQHAESEALSPEQERTQAEFVPRSFAVSLAAGVDKHFFFVLPHYPERGVQFGSMRPDTSPRPGLVAIATAVRVLGEAKYLGKLDVEGVEAYAFDSGREPIAVLWAEEEMNVELPLAKGAGLVDVVGRESDITDGVVTARVAAQYVVGLGDVAGMLTGDVRPAGELPELDPSKVVLCGYVQGATVDKDRNAEVVAGLEPMTYVVDVYNLSEAESTKGTVSLELPEGWTGEKLNAEVELEPMGRESLSFELDPSIGSGVGAAAKVWARGEFAGPEVAPCVSYVRFDVAGMEPSRRQALELDDPDLWSRNICAGGTVDIGAGEEGGVVFDITFQGPADPWCYPTVSFEPTADWSDYQGLAYEYRFDVEEESTTTRTQIAEEGGSAYMCGAQPSRTEWTRVVALFGDLVWGTHSPADDNNKLDADRITRAMIGCNTKKLEKFRLEVRDVELVAFD